MVMPARLSILVRCAAAGLFLLLAACVAESQQPTPTVALPTAALSTTAPLPTPAVIIQPNPTNLSPALSPTTAEIPALATLPPTDIPPTATLLPTQIPAYQASGPYAVINVSQNSVLVVHESPSATAPRLAALSYNDTGLTRTGRSEQVGDTLWWELALSGGQAGWVNSAFLTEDVVVTDFCADARIPTLLAALKQAYNTADGALYSSLISPRSGLDVTYLHTGRTANYNTEEAKFVFTSNYVMNWGMHPASGLDIKGTFRETVLPFLVEVLNAPYTLTCNAPGPGATNYTMNWPSRYENIRYMALFKPGSPGVEMDWRVWLIGFETIEGKPYLFSMIQFFWEP